MLDLYELIGVPENASEVWIQRSCQTARDRIESDASLKEKNVRWRWQTLLMPTKRSLIPKPEKPTTRRWNAGAKPLLLVARW